MTFGDNDMKSGDKIRLCLEIWDYKTQTMLSV